MEDMDSGGLCYICCDKRRRAEIDAVLMRLDDKPYEDTYKEILLKVIIDGTRDGVDVCENEMEVESETVSGHQSLSLKGDLYVENLYKRVEKDSIMFICQRCQRLLRDFDYHEKQAALIGEAVRKFITKQRSTDGSDKCNSFAGTQSSECKEKKLLDEKRGILAALRVMRRSNPIVRTKGRKRKGSKVISSAHETEPSEDAETDSVDQERRNASMVRASKRIQRRREEGRVVHWGDVQGETTTIGSETGSQEESFLGELKPRRRGRKPNSCKMSTLSVSEDAGKIPRFQPETSLKYQCPFCYRYYVPSLSRIHGCISYKNELRCFICNIFFTSYVRLEKHLEVIHLREKELKCPESGCSFTCISHPAIVLHEHFHRLSEHGLGSNLKDPDNFDASVPSHIVVTPDLITGKGVTIEDDELGDVCSPDTADEVSFDLDERTLGSGQPVSITVNTVRVKGTPKETLTRDGNSKKFTYQCNICDKEFRSKRLLDDHSLDIHVSSGRSLSSYSSGLKSRKTLKLFNVNTAPTSSSEIFVKDGLVEGKRTLPTELSKTESETEENLPSESSRTHLDMKVTLYPESDKCKHEVKVESLSESNQTQLFVKTGSSSESSRNETLSAESSKAVYACTCCRKKFVVESELDDHIKDCPGGVTKHDDWESDEVTEEKPERFENDSQDLKYENDSQDSRDENDSQDSREAPVSPVKKNFSLAPTPVLVMGKVRDPNR